MLVVARAEEKKAPPLPRARRNCDVRNENTRSVRIVPGTRSGPRRSERSGTQCAKPAEPPGIGAAPSQAMAAGVVAPVEV